MSTEIGSRILAGLKVFITANLFAALLGSCRSSPVSPMAGSNVGISYSLQVRSAVTLTVENSYNTTMKTLVDTTQDSGMYTVTWNTNGYPPGLYFYSLTVVPQDGGAELRRTARIVLME